MVIFMRNKIKLFALCTIPIMASASPFDDLINKHAQLTGLDPKLVKAVITRESNFNPNARSPKDARGLMQVIPSTAKLMGVNPSRLYEPEQSIIAGTRYLAFLSKRFNGDFTKMVAGYNAGHGAVEKFGGIPPYRETQNYVRLVSAKYKTLGGTSSYKQSFSDKPTVQTSKQNMLVLASWQQNQYPSYKEAENSNNESNDSYIEPVRLKAVSSTMNTSSQVEPKPQSFVQTLNKGEYISVF